MKINKKKIFFSILNIPFFIVLFIILIIIMFFGMLGNSLTASPTKTLDIREELLDNYKVLADKFERKTGILISIKYIYAMDGAIRKGDFLHPEDLYVTNQDMYCMTQKDEDGNLHFNGSSTYVSNCMGWKGEQTKLYGYYLELYEKIGSLGDGNIDVDNNGDGTIDVADVEGFVRPVNSGTVTNEFHGWDALNQNDGHTGIDISGGSTTIYPTADGTVINVFYDEFGGNQVTILHNMEGKMYISNYAHMLKSTVTIGEEVDLNTQIGVMGETGVATGVHLHFEIMKGSSYIHSQLENPRRYVKFPKLGEYWFDRE